MSRTLRARPEGLHGILGIAVGDLSASGIGERLAVAVEQAHDAIVITDASGRILYVNPAFEANTGYTRAEAVGRTPSILKSGAHGEAFYRELWETILDGRVWRGVFVNRRKDGTLFEEESTISPIVGRDGEVTGFVAVKRDVSECRERERELAVREARYRSLFENSRDAILITDAHGKLKDVNPAAVELTGYSESELRNFKIKHLFPREKDRRRFTEAVARDGFVERLPQRLRRADGEERECLVSASVWRGAGGEILGYQSIVRDVTESRRNQRLMKAVMESFPDPVLMADEKGRIVLANAAAESAFGQPTGDLTGLPLAELVTPPGGWAGDLLRMGEGDDGGAAPEEWTAHPFSGAGFPVEATLGRARTSDGTYLLVSLRDVREKRSLETQLRHAQKIDAIGRLAAGIAHEINTPIQYVGDNTRFLQEAFGDLVELFRRYDAALSGEAPPDAAEKARQHREEIDLDYLLEEIPRAIDQTLEGVRRVAGIVQAMKQFSHPGQNREPADLNKAIQSTVTVARNEWKYVAEMELDLAEDLPAVPCIVSDINQVILNLVVNAAHAIAEVRGERPETKGRIAVRTRVEGEEAVVVVEDDGCGIPPENLERIFEPFFTTKEVGKGTGQGLSIAHHVIVEEHGGTISVDSEVGRGTKFTIRLPLRSGAEDEESQP
ncbi:MAG: PAS domain S-box protein [Acidobacteria bacterium]|nr:MAG: PAS domain S-box protein [Acidobacteriota bacterium]